MNFTKKLSMTAVAAIFAVIPLALVQDPAMGADADSLHEAVNESGVRGGLMIILGCRDGREPATLDSLKAFTVQGLSRDPDTVAAARAFLRKEKLYGPISIERLSGDRLPYVDHLVNLAVVRDPSFVSMEEVKRVLAPHGVAMIFQDGKWKKHVEPRPATIDHWTHYLHDASNNAVAHDEEVAPPKRAHWLAAPYWARSHEFNPSVNAAVAGDGRLFYTLDEGIPGIPDTPHHRFPARWSLIARDAHSGVELWKRPIPNWGYREWNTVGMWSAPLTLPRRLVTDGKNVYFTFGYEAPVSVLDAVTGKTIAELPDTNGTDEMVLSDGILVLAVRDHLSKGVPWKTPPKRRRNPHEFNIDPPGNTTLMAFDTQTKKLLWKKPKRKITVITLGAANGRVTYYDEAGHVACLDLVSGEEKWTAPCKAPGGSRHSGGTLVQYQDLVLYTSAEGTLAFSAENGKRLWKGPRTTGPGISHPGDLFVADGLVWTGTPAGTHRKDDTGVTREGRDPFSGEVRREISVPKLISPLHHFRCYRSKATDHYLLLPKRGVEFLDLRGEDHMRHDWLRAGCHYGFIPANGLLYVTPHHCFCYPGVKLNGFLALKGNAKQPEEESSESRLEKGPAFGKISDSREMIGLEEDWPTYRHDAKRTGHVSTIVPEEMNIAWEREIGGKLSQPVIAQGRVFVSNVDGQAIEVFHAEDGRKLWEYIPGARVDTPPTVIDDKVIFGCRDGWVYCLTASEGTLVWRFQAASQEKRLVSFDQIESPWPVAGSVLVQNGIAYVAAGRSTFLDGGIHLYGLDPASGKIICRNHIEGPWPDPVNETGRPFDMEGSKSDLLVGDGENVYLFQKSFDAKLNEIETSRATPLGDRKTGLHLMSTGGFVDYQWYDRTFWVYSQRWPGFYFTNDGPKAGQILVFDDEVVYGLHVFRRRDRLSPGFTPGDGYELFADAVETEPALTGKSAGREKGPGYSRPREPLWSKNIKLRVRGLVLAGDRLVMAGPPDIVPENDPYAGFEGRLGSRLRVVSAKDGAKISEMEMASPPVFDGMAVAGSKVFLATEDGKLICLVEK